MCENLLKIAVYASILQKLYPSQSADVFLEVFSSFYL